MNTDSRIHLVLDQITVRKLNVLVAIGALDEDACIHVAMSEYLQEIVDVMHRDHVVIVEDLLETLDCCEGPDDVDDTEEQ